MNITSTHVGSTSKQSERLIREYPQLLQGVGKLINFKTKIHTDDSVQPVALPQSRVPFHVRQRVTAEEQRLEDLDIIEHVSRPTPWIAPVAAVQRKSGDIRLCVVMRQTNVAIKRERHPGPILGDLAADLNGATVFSTIDMREGYHQIKQEEESRHVTTFSTHVGLRRYKRLIMRTSSAAEVFHHLFEQVIKDIPALRNVANDVIIFGKAQDCHDTSIRLLLRILS